MNAKEYCQKIEREDLSHKQLYDITPIRENNSPLVSLKKTGINLIFEPSVKKDYKYLVREEIVEKIDRINRILEKENKVLIIRSAWRAFSHQKLLWDNRVAALKKEYPEKKPVEIRKIASYFIAHETKSLHATGGSIDALIYDSISDKVMDFGTNEGLIIHLSRECYPYHPDIALLAKNNRKLLIDLFENEDFVCDLKEYWHFDFGNVNWAVRKEKKNAFYGIIKERISP